MPDFARPHVLERLYVRLWWVHHWRLSPGWTWKGPPQRPFTSVWYVLEGALGARQGEVEFSLQPQQLAIIPPGARVVSWNATPRELVYLSLGCEVRIDEIDLFADRSLTIARVRLPDPVTDLWLQMEQTAAKCAAQEEPLDRLALSGMVRLWWADLCRATGVRLEDRASRLHPGLLRALQFIRANLSQPLTAAGVARHVYLSEGYLRDLFRAELNTSFSRVLREMRFTHAKALLLSSDLSIGEIARRVGYSDVHHFSGAFSRHEQTTPSAYRVNFRRNGI